DGRELLDCDADSAISDSVITGPGKRSGDRAQQFATADPGQPGVIEPRHWNGCGFALRHPTAGRYLWVGAGARSWRRGQRDQQDCRSRKKECTARVTGEYSRTDPNHAFVVYGPAWRFGVLDRAGLSADRGEFSVLAGSVYHYFSAACGPCGYCLVPF